MVDSEPRQKNPYRIERDVVPLAYQLRIEPDLAKSTFRGAVNINIELANHTSKVILNAVELDFDEVVIHLGDLSMPSKSVAFDETFETATIEFAEDLAPGHAILSIKFHGALNEQLRGFYRSTYDDANGRCRTIATTQFAPTDARRAFPCWDDPASNATFQVTLVIPGDLAAFSNTSEISSTLLDDGRREIVFASTMVMSTYLVAFVIGPFSASAPTVASGVPIRVVSPLGKGHLSGWALEIAAHAIEFFTDYFAIPYPGDKIDLIAIPDFAFGAMENLGCVTFREEYLLIDVNTASHSEQMQVAIGVNHELAHMWFGDLVTMDWWEGIWLNEAFATFMESICTDHLRPEWKKWSSFHFARDRAFTVDGQHSTRPIEYHVVSPDDSRGMFDILTYIKGCAVLRMLEQYLREDVFRDGVRHYLREHAYANAVTSDLWSALESASEKPVGKIMDTWILQGGFPLISVRDNVIAQEPFFFAPTDAETNIGERWYVPLLVRSLDGGPMSSHLLDGPTMELPLDSSSLVNAGGWGFFRTTYDSKHLTGIVDRFDHLDDLERAVLLSDTWASILVGKSSFTDLFRLASGLAPMDEPTTWKVVILAIDMASRIVDDAARDQLASTARTLFGPAFDRLGWEPRPEESTQAGELRALVIGALGTYGQVNEIIDEAVARFDAKRVVGDLADAIVSITMHQGRPGDPAECDARRATAATPQEEQRYLFAPAHSDDVEVVSGAVRAAFDTVRTQDAPYLLGSMMTNRLTGPGVWRSVRDRWDEAIARFPSTSWAPMLTGITTFAADAQLAEEVRAFHEQHPLEVGQRDVAQSLDAMDVNVALARRNQSALADELRDFC